MIVINKKGETDDPQNFRPLTLEATILKEFTSLIRDRMYSFLVANKYIKTNIQKGLVPGMTGPYEHIVNLSYAINQARNKQRNLTVTLINLRNAFGEVHHNLIQTVFEYRHIPLSTHDLVKLIYINFHTAVIMDAFVSDFIKVAKGVLQGDCLSTLLFNLVINTFTQHIKQNHYNQLGYCFFAELIPRYWFQFVDNAAAVSSLESENQMLLNAFTRWCTCAGIIIYIDKCHSFGVKKINTKMKQIKPKLYQNNEYIKPVEIGESFLYLGHYFDMEMTSNKCKEILANELKDIIALVDNLPLHPKNKILIYQRYIVSKLSWHLTVSDLNITWIK